MRRTPRPSALSLAALLLVAPRAVAQGGAVRLPPRPQVNAQPWDPARAFLAPYGLQNFPPQYVHALQALLEARAQYEARDFPAARATLDALWQAHPVADPSWAALPTQPFGIFLGTPPCYYALRMLTDMTQWRVQNPGQPPAPRTARLTVLVVGQSNGLQPQNLAQLTAGTGVHVVHALDPRVTADNHRVVHHSLELFREHVLRMTQGLLAVDTRILSLPAVNLPVHAGVGSGGYFYASLVDANQVFASVPAAEIEATDWWWILYPSHVPEQYPAFQTTEFITGGMGTGPGSRSPFFIIDDRWLVRKPPHLGAGEYSDVERSVYLPQWLQHEFFHHLFRTYPGFGLEDTPHQWFNLATWPPDFVGRYEADYFHEALHRRLLTALPPLNSALRYATAGAPWDQITLGQVLGTYHRNPIQNPWHIGEIRFSGPQLQWRNTAPFSWNLYPDLLNGRLATGPDCPYYTAPNGQRFDIVLERDALGDMLPVIRGFGFLGDLYRRQ